jgi:hypothetical protein
LKSNLGNCGTETPRFRNKTKTARMNEQEKFISAEEMSGVRYTEEYQAKLKIKRDFFAKIAPDIDERLAHMKAQIFQSLQTSWFSFPFDPKNHEAQLQMTFEEMLRDGNFRKIVRDVTEDSFEFFIDTDTLVDDVDEQDNEPVILSQKFETVDGEDDEEGDL